MNEERRRPKHLIEAEKREKKKALMNLRLLGWSLRGIV